ncbi:MAG: DUF2877 domain-containing protein [Nocardioidaceae bacterium]
MTPVSATLGRPAAASSLLRDLLAGATALDEVARTRMSVHYETGRVDVPVLCLALLDAVRLPSSVLTPELPAAPLRLDAGVLHTNDAHWPVSRWWQPPRPSGLVPPVAGRIVDFGPMPYGDVDPHELVGAGEGLTPSGDDLLAAALVTARATADPRLDGWCDATRDALRSRRTTAVSRALLRHALDGWCVPELAEFLTVACSGADPTAAADRLRAIGHSSGQALLDGAVYVLSTRLSTHPRALPGEGAA